MDKEGRKTGVGSDTHDLKLQRFTELDSARYIEFECRKRRQDR